MYTHIVSPPTCAICLQAAGTNGGATRKLICCKKVHCTACIEPWLAIKPSCPACRAPTQPSDAALRTDLVAKFAAVGDRRFIHTHTVCLTAAYEGPGCCPIHRGGPAMQVCEGDRIRHVPAHPPAPAPMDIFDASADGAAWVMGCHITRNIIALRAGDFVITGCVEEDAEDGEGTAEADIRVDQSGVVVF